MHPFAHALNYLKQQSSREILNLALLILFRSFNSSQYSSSPCFLTGWSSYHRLWPYWTRCCYTFKPAWTSQLAPRRQGRQNFTKANIFAADSDFPPSCFYFPLQLQNMTFPSFLSLLLSLILYRNLKLVVLHALMSPLKVSSLTWAAMLFSLIINISMISSILPLAQVAMYGTPLNVFPTCG